MKTALIAILISSLCNGCGILPAGTTYVGEEKLFSKAIGNTKVQYRQAQGREPGWELGIAFLTKAKGRINGLHIKNPTKGMVTVTIWDGDTKQIIYQMQANLNGTDSYNKIYMHQPVLLEQGRRYCITINVTQYYYQVLPFNPFPYEATNVTLLGSVYEETHYTRYPQFELRDVFHGMIDVDLQWQKN